MPNGFLPPPVKFAQQFSGTALPLKLAKDNLLNKTVRFAALQTRAFYLCSANTAFDTSMQSVTSRTTCDQCFRSLPSKAQKLVYRRALHKFVRKNEIEIEKLSSLEHEKRLKYIKSIRDHNLSSKEYKAIFTNGDVD